MRRQNAGPPRFARVRQVGPEEAGARRSGCAWHSEAQSGDFEAEYGVQLIDFRESLTNGEPAGKFLTAIDVGSAKTCALVAEMTDCGLRYRGHGIADSRGSRKGVIVELDKAVASIQKAVECAEDIAGAPVEHAIVGLGGANVKGINSHGGISLGSRPREIGRTRLSRPLSVPARFLFPRTAKSFICCPRNSYWTISRVCTTRSA